MRNIIVFGASGHGSVVLDCIEKEGKYNVIGFVDSFKRKGTKINGYEVLGSEFDLPYLMNRFNLDGGIVAIGDNWTRKLIVDRIIKVVPHFNFVNTIHPKAVVGKDVMMGCGNVFMPGTIINANSIIHDFCIINTNSSLGHDGIMESYSSLAPSVSTGGNLKLGKFSAISLGANIINGIEIGSHTVIGAGSLVVNSFGDELVAYGSPAKVVRKRVVGEPYLYSCKEQQISKEKILKKI
ncbi:acetyltransferase [Maribacter sp. X9]|uniref:acetyltransferase n=1 Tax=Maribacter sp. X9 TaxID=3402159 RepID=UPI003AF3FD75